MKSELETSHTEDNTQFNNIPSADDLSINVKPHVIILESVPVSAEESPVNSQETGQVPTTKEPNYPQLGNEIITLRSNFKKSRDLEEKISHKTPVFRQKILLEMKSYPLMKVPIRL